VSDDAFVIEADTHVKIPLPGSEGDHCEGEGQVVDVVVCALSLMGTNWPNCIREAWRILKYGFVCPLSHPTFYLAYLAERGGLEIAEVASRFTDVDEFTSLVTAIGFKLNSKVH
jgi:ribosomal RNA-processing protein 8